mmetsp:Transcript_5001/g.7641  ORF Transcript_5001/g.7641 Transcript_5001/m.7641 type:complete len:232 (+) Transcript_5001:92-787(+)
MSSFGSRTSTGSKVVLNVYDLGPYNDMLYQWGMGTYHSGVHVNGREFTFAEGAGVFSHEPKDVPGDARFREAIELGSFSGSLSEFDGILDELRSQFAGNSYNVLTKNCNHFAEAFVLKLLNKPIPGYVNRLATLGGMVSCLFPPSMLGNAPVNQQKSTDVSGGNAYQVIAPRNKVPTNQPTPAPLQAFAGSGRVLGSSSGTSSTSENLGLNDRRERARAAALKRFEGNAST